MKHSRNESKTSVVWTALRAARTLLLLLEAGDLTETVEDNKDDDDEPVCGEGGGGRQ